MRQKGKKGLSPWLVNVGIRVLLGALHLLPYRLRLQVGSKVFAAVLAPLAGYRRRIEANLDLVRLDLDEDTRARLARRVPEMVCRTLIELFSPKPFKEIAHEAPIHGEGLQVLEDARAAGRPCIIVSGHFGNYDAVRASLLHRGFNVGGLYRRMNNPYFHADYLRTIETIGTPLFERSKLGMADMVRFLRGGGVLALLIDQHMDAGEPLTFFGRTAITATSAAKLALKYDAPLLPVYGVRRPDGIHFDVHIEAAIPPSDEVTMTQALNDSLEARVRDNMDQWLWIHRRWKD